MKSKFLWFWHLDTRLLELFMGLELLRRGTFWATGIAPMQAPSYEPMVRVMSSHAWGYLFLLIGTVQITGVFINGNWRKSPYLRMSALTFCITAYTLLGQVFGGSLNPGAALQSSTQQYLVAIACLWCLLNIAAKHNNDA